jgi:hypothetical protein
MTALRVMVGKLFEAMESQQISFSVICDVAGLYRADRVGVVILTLHRSHNRGLH